MCDLFGLNRCLRGDLQCRSAHYHSAKFELRDSNNEVEKIHTNCFFFLHQFRRATVHASEATNNEPKFKKRCCIQNELSHLTQRCAHSMLRSWQHCVISFFLSLALALFAFQYIFGRQQAVRSCCSSSQLIQSNRNVRRLGVSQKWRAGETTFLRLLSMQNRT